MAAPKMDSVRLATSTASESCSISTTASSMSESNTCDVTTEQVARLPAAWARHLNPDWEATEALSAPARECILWHGPVRFEPAQRTRALPYLRVGAQRFSMRQIMAIRSGIIPPAAGSVRIKMCCGNQLCVNAKHMSVTSVMPFKRPDMSNMYARRKRPREEDMSTMTDALTITDYSTMSQSCDEQTSDGFSDTFALPASKLPHIEKTAE